MTETCETGCFVYQVVSVNTCVKYTPEVRSDNNTHVAFAVGDFIAVDLVLWNGGKVGEDGPFIRLADGSGWMSEFFRGERCVKKIPVETGLWILYTDNYPAGVTLRSHPMDRAGNGSDNVPLFTSPKTTIPPMTKIYCDRKVVGQYGSNFYRLQGKFNSWVFDRRKTSRGANDFISFTISEDKVRTGLFAFKALMDLGVRHQVHVAEPKLTGHTIRKGEVVVCDIIRESPHVSSTSGPKSGPYLRLTDGSGWLFEFRNNQRCMQQLPIGEGTWKLRVRQPLRLRGQPTDSEESKLSLIYNAGVLVDCDRMIESSSGTHFYRVKDTQGWLRDRCGNERMVQVINGPPSLAEEGSWSPEFVRGIATTVGNIKEISLNKQSRVISFRNEHGVRINVYYTSRTVGTCMDHPTQGKTQLFRRTCTSSELVEIFKNPRLHTNKGYQTKKRKLSNLEGTSTQPISEADKVERELRNALIECERTIKKLEQKRDGMLKPLLVRDSKRLRDSTRMKALNKKYKEYVKKKELQRRQAQQRQQEQLRLQEQQRQQKAQRRRQEQLRQELIQYCGQYEYQDLFRCTYCSEEFTVHEDYVHHQNWCTFNYWGNRRN